MSKIRLLILIFGPLVIVWASLSLTHWLHVDRQLAYADNVALRSLGESVAEGAEVSQAPAAPDLKMPCHEIAARLSKRLGEKCRVIVRSPFVIAGDQTDEQLERWHADTIGPAARAMANTYFNTPPGEPITVLLFDGEQSYNHYAAKLYGDSGISIYGYYKPKLRILVMNIATGGGTLVHELTHALMDFDFPKVPDWFNEGLASLHEQCDFRQDAKQGLWIEGLENWRLPGLQEAVRKKRLRSLSSLIKDNDFRAKLEGTNYAQARYFCLYMQRQGVLKDYYRHFHEHRQDDPLGHAAVAHVFPQQSWEELDAAFQKWVLTLKR